VQHFGTGHKESIFFNAKYSEKKVQYYLERYGIFQFHDTSARMRGNCELHNNRYLMNDGSNLAAVLYKLQETQFPYYERIVETIRQIAPFFEDFVLEPLALNPNYIQLSRQKFSQPRKLLPRKLALSSLKLRIWPPSIV